MSETTPVRTLDPYPVKTVQILRYADTDRQGHVNNAVFATLCESGRVDFLYDPNRPLYPDGAQFVIAKLSLDFIAELNWPGEVTIGTGVVRVGRSSITLHQTIVGAEGCVATSESIIVLMDETTRKSTPLPDSTVAILNGLHVTA